jgi:hypothetical protein
VDNFYLADEIIEKVSDEIMDKALECNCWNTHAIYGVYHQGKEIDLETRIKDELKEHGLEDNVQNRYKVFVEFSTDYVEWMRIHKDWTVTFGQGSYTVHTKLEDIIFEPIKLLSYESKYRMYIPEDKFNVVEREE